MRSLVSVMEGKIKHLNLFMLAFRVACSWIFIIVLAGIYENKQNLC